MKRAKLVAVVLLAVLLTYGVVQAVQFISGRSADLENLRRENAVLTATNTRQAQAVTDAEGRVTASDSAAAVVDSVANARVADADRQLVTQAAHFRGLLAGRPDLAIAFDSVEAAHAAKLRAVEDRAARKDLLRLAQIDSRDSLIVRQRDQIQTQAALIENLEGQVSVLDPPFFARLFGDLPKIAGTIGASYLGATLDTQTPERGAAIGAGLAQILID